MSSVKIAYRGGMGFQAQAGPHTILIDLPREKGGEDAGMDPPDVFLSSLGACVGVYVVRYCRNVPLDCNGLTITVDGQLSDDKTKISVINVTLRLPQADVGKREKALLEVAHHCLLHHTILENPQIQIALIK